MNATKQLLTTASLIAALAGGGGASAYAAESTMHGNDDWAACHNLTEDGSKHDQSCIMYHRTVKGDTLWNISWRYCHTHRKWHVIADLNEVDPRRVPVNTVLLVACGR